MSDDQLNCCLCRGRDSQEHEHLLIPHREEVHRWWNKGDDDPRDCHSSHWANSGSEVFKVQGRLIVAIAPCCNPSLVYRDIASVIPHLEDYTGRSIDLHMDGWVRLDNLDLYNVYPPHIRDRWRSDVDTLEPVWSNGHRVYYYCLQDIARQMPPPWKCRGCKRTYVKWSPERHHELEVAWGAGLRHHNVRTYWWREGTWGFKLLVRWVTFTNRHRGKVYAMPIPHARKADELAEHLEEFCSEECFRQVHRERRHELEVERREFLRQARREQKRLEGLQHVRHGSQMLKQARKMIRDMTGGKDPQKGQ